MFFSFHCVGTIVLPLIAFITFAKSALGAPGDLDTGGFGAGTGKTHTAIGPAYDRAAGIALLPDGRIVAAGTCHNGTDYDFCLARYLPTGALDTSFNGTGTILTTIGAQNDVATAIALQADGKVVVSGYCENSGRVNFCAARYLATGAIDSSFSGTGKVITQVGAVYGLATALALQPDGRIVVVGVCYDGGNTDFCLARYLPSGTLDTSFNGNGKLVSPIGPSDDSAQSVALQADGKIVVAGYCISGGAKFCVARYQMDGGLDTAFNSTGKTLTSFGASDDTAYSVATQHDGKIVVAGECRNLGSADFCLARYRPNGTLDTDFNGSGKVRAAVGANDDVATALALQPDGKIAAAGLCANGGNYDFCLARYLANGAPDISFGNAGVVITPIGTSQDHGRAVTLQPDGKIVVAGSCDVGSRTDFCLARYQGGPFEARNCTMDIDGDNQVLATTDSLIHTRIALGISGSAVLSGITFAPHASRTTWPAIRDYLVSQCGMSIVP